MAKIEVTRARKGHKVHHKNIPPRRAAAGISARTKSMIAAAAILLLALLIIFSPRLFPRQEANEDVVAVINGQQISLSYFEKEYSLVPQSYRAFMTEEVFLNQTIVTQALFIQEADRKGIQATDQETTEFLAYYLNSTGYTEEE